MTIETTIHEMIIERLMPVVEKLSELEAASAMPEQNAVSEMVAKAVEQLAPRTTTFECKTWTGEVNTIETAHPLLSKITALVTSQTLEYRNVYVYGKAGTGKTKLGFDLGRALGLPVHIQGTAMSKYDLIGYRLPSGEVVRTPFMDAWCNGGLIILDDNDRSEPRAMSNLNASLANGKCDFSNSGLGVIDRHPDCIVMITGNTPMNGQNVLYNTASKQDGALRDRLLFWELELDETLELSLAPVERWALRVQKIRKAASDIGGNIENQILVTMRATLQGTEALFESLTQAEAEESLIFKGAGDDVKSQIYSKVGEPSDTLSTIENFK